MVHSEAIFAPSPAYPSCHAATIVDLPGGDLLAAWFAGSHEGHPDVGIWLARHTGGRWSVPQQVAAEPGVPCWNPVLFRDAGGTLWLFYKVAPTIPAWAGVYIRSHDGGRTWSPPTVLPAGLLGPAKNKPLTLANGDLLCPTSAEAWQTWACWVEISCDGGRTWAKHGPVTAPEALTPAPLPSGERGDMPRQHMPLSGAGEGLGRGLECRGGARSKDEPVSATWDADARELRLPQEFPGVIQPTVWEYAPGRLRMLMRSTRRVGAVCASASDDYGRTWSPAVPTAIPNPNSGLDAVRLADGRIVLACNPVPEGRTPLSLLVSADNGETWPVRIDLETGEGEYSYPSIIQAADGRIHIVYTWRRTTIRHAALGPNELMQGVIRDA